MTPLVLVAVLIVLLPGCALNEIRSKNKFGPEYRHRGIAGTDETRWTSQTGIELKWDRGISTGVTYRRRDVDDGSGSNDNGVWLDFSFPVWTAEKKVAPLERRVQALERRLAVLEPPSGKERHKQ